MRKTLKLAGCGLGCLLALSNCQSEAPSQWPSKQKIQKTVETFWRQSGHPVIDLVIVDVVSGEVVGEWPWPAVAKRKAGAPGAAFLPVMAVAALRAGAITPEQLLPSPGEMLIEGHVMNSWKREGWGKLNLHEALVESANSYFYQLGIMTPPEDLARTARDLGVTSLIPTPEWLKKEHPKETWTKLASANLAIGQGHIRLTPLDLAQVMATIARREPSILSPENWQVIHTALRDRMRKRLPKDFSVEFAGFTGTAVEWMIRKGEQRKEMLSWFAGFFPTDQPRYALCLLVINADRSNEAFLQAQALVKHLAEIKNE